MSLMRRRRPSVVEQLMTAFQQHPEQFDPCLCPNASVCIQVCDVPDTAVVQSVLQEVCRLDADNKSLRLEVREMSQYKKRFSTVSKKCQLLTQEVDKKQSKLITLLNEAAEDRVRVLELSTERLLYRNAKLEALASTAALREKAERAALKAHLASKLEREMSALRQSVLEADQSIAELEAAHGGCAAREELFRDEIRALQAQLAHIRDAQAERQVCDRQERRRSISHMLRSVDLLAEAITVDDDAAAFNAAAAEDVKAAAATPSNTTLPNNNTAAAADERAPAVTADEAAAEDPIAAANAAAANAVAAENAAAADAVAANAAAADAVASFNLAQMSLSASIDETKACKAQVAQLEKQEAPQTQQARSVSFDHESQDPEAAESAASPTRDRRDTLHVPDITGYVHEGDGWFQSPDGCDQEPVGTALQEPVRAALKTAALKALGGTLQMSIWMRTWRSLSQWRSASVAASAWDLMCGNVATDDPPVYIPATENISRATMFADETRFLQTEPLSRVVEEAKRDTLHADEIKLMQQASPQELEGKMQDRLTGEYFQTDPLTMAESFAPLLSSTNSHFGSPQQASPRTLVKLSALDKANMLAEMTTDQQEEILGTMSEQELENIPFNL